MQATKAKKTGGKTRKDRKGPFPGKLSAGQNGSPKGRINDPGQQGIGFSVLEKSLRTIPLLEAAMTIGLPYEKDILAMIDTEEKQLQAICDLYEIVKAQPKYKKMKEPVWSLENKPISVLYWLLRKLGPLAGGEEWSIDTYKEGKKTRYRFVAYKYYHSMHVKPREEFMPMDFLPALLNRDKPLHDLVIETVALVSRFNKIPLWDEDGDFSVHLNEFLKTAGSDENYVLHGQYVSYKSGPAFQYLKLIKARRKKVTTKSLWRAFVKYDAKSNRKQQFKWWIRKAISLASYKQDISKNSFVPNYLTTETPMTPFRLYKFIWSSHEHDIVRAKAYYWIDKAQRQDILLPVMFSIAKPGRRLGPIEFDRFPMDLYEFMSYGVGHVLWRFRDYYYKNQMEEKLTPSEQMLEQLNKIEIKNIRRNGQHLDQRPSFAQ